MLACVFVPTVALSSQKGAAGARGNNEKPGSGEKQVCEGELLLQVSTSPHTEWICLYHSVHLLLQFMSC